MLLVTEPSTLGMPGEYATSELHSLPTETWPSLEFTM